MPHLLLHLLHILQAGTIHFLSPDNTPCFGDKYKKSFPELGSWKTRPLYFWNNSASNTQSFFFLASSSQSSTHAWKIRWTAGSFNIPVLTSNFLSCKSKLILSSPNIASGPVASTFSIWCWCILASCILAVTYMTLLFSVDSPPRWDRLTPSLICLTPPQLLSAGSIPHSFDVTQPPTYPNTTVYGREYFSCHKYDFPLTQSELAQRLISWYGWVQFWNALNSFQKVSMILRGNIVWTVGFGLGQGGTWWQVTTFSIASWCSPVNWSRTSVQIDPIMHNAQAAIQYSCSMRCLRLF